MALPMYLLYEGGLVFAAIMRHSSMAAEESKPEQGSA